MIMKTLMTAAITAVASVTALGACGSSDDPVVPAVVVPSPPFVVKLIGFND